MSATAGDGGAFTVEIRRRGRRRKVDASRYPGFRWRADGPRRRVLAAHGLSRADAESFAAKARADGLSAAVVDEAWVRSPDYRRRFVEADPGPYRCRYCNRRLDRGSMTVDHLVPVDAASQSSPLPRRRLARALLARMGAGTVNDLANLVPACGRCNSRKGAKMGLWTLRGLLGAKPAYWACLRTAQAALALAALAAAYAALSGALPGLARALRALLP